MPKEYGTCKWEHTKQAVPALHYTGTSYTASTTGVQLVTLVNLFNLHNDFVFLGRQLANQ